MDKCSKDATTCKIGCFDAESFVKNSSSNNGVVSDIKKIENPFNDPKKVAAKKVCNTKCMDTMMSCSNKCPIMSWLCSMEC